MSEEKKRTNSVLLIVFVFFIIFVFLQYLFYNHILPDHPTTKLTFLLFKPFHPFLALDMPIRIVFVILMVFYATLIPSLKINKNETKETIRSYQVIAIFTNITFIIGYIGVAFYDLFIFPAVIIANLFISFKALSFLRKKFDHDVIFGVNSFDKGDCVFRLQLSEKEAKKTGCKELVIPYANTGIITEGSPKAGKSASIIQPIIYQAGLMGMAGLIYDLNGNPSKPNQPILSKTAYLSVIHGKEKAIREGREYKTRFAFLNYSNPEKTVRVNTLSPRYIKNKLHIINNATSILKNLEPSWREKMDFWGQNAVALLTATIHMLHKNYPQYCTLPHAISFLLSDYNLSLPWLASDPEIRTDFMPVYSAFVSRAEGQLAGAIASVQAPLLKLRTPEIYWVHSADEFDLDITKPDHPSILCIGSDFDLKEALAAPISSIVLTCQGLMNQPGKADSIFCFDEIPTIMLYGVDDFIANCRKNHVCCIFGLQTHEQFMRNYGEKSANIIRDNVSNQFFGYTSSEKTARYVSDMIGNVRKKEVSYSENTDTMSVSESQKNDKLIQQRDVQGQPVGHFIGKVADGKPPYFNLQFDYYKLTKDEIQIPDFAIDVRNSTESKDIDKDLIKQMMLANYKSINEEVNNILWEYREKNPPPNSG